MQKRMFLNTDNRFPGQHMTDRSGKKDIVPGTAGGKLIAETVPGAAGGKPDAKDREAAAAGVILAAGRSSRMGRMKMLLPLGESTVLGQGVTTMLKAGADPLVVVTGRDAEAVKESLKGLPVHFIHNPDFETTQMLDSVKLGLKMVSELTGDREVKVLVAPGDNPLYSTKTLKLLIAAGTDIAVPECEGKTGHPVCVSSCLIPAILAYEGGGGLAGALGSMGETYRLEVDDRGILCDADTPEDYKELCRLAALMKE